MTMIPRFIRNASFKQQVNVAVTVGVFCFALFSSLLTSWQGSRQIRHTLLNQGTRIAENLASQSALALLYASADNADEVVNTTLSFPDVTRVEIRHANGRPLVIRNRPAVAGDTGADEPMPDLAARTAYLETETSNSLRFVAPVLVKGGIASPFEVEQRSEEILGFVRVEQSKETLSRMMMQALLVNSAVSFLFALAFLFVIGLLAKRVTQPITMLSEAMARAEHGESDVRAVVEGPRDIREMAQAFNSMIAALQDRAEALRESKESYRQVVDNIKEVIFQTNAAGEWILLNPAWQEITGLDVKKALGRPLSDFVKERDRQLVMRWQERMQKGDANACRYEVRFIRRNGESGWLKVTQQARYDHGVFAGTSGTLDDITERKMAAVQLERLNVELEHRVRTRTAQLEASNQELEAFSYSVSHDLRAPLRAIDGFARILEEDCGEKIDDAGRDYLSRIRNASQRMSQLIDDMIEMARISRIDVRFEATDLSSLARDVVRELVEAEPERQVEIKIEDGMVVNADPTLMRAVLDNLLRNAWKFTGKGAAAQITFATTTRQGDGGGEEKVYFVRDNGAGFDMAYANKLFRPFSRLHPAAQFAGTGVGLATVQRIVQRHGGTIWAEGEIERGATFYFTLPEPVAPVSA